MWSRGGWAKRSTLAQLSGAQIESGECARLRQRAIAGAGAIRPDVDFECGTEAAVCRLSGKFPPNTRSNRRQLRVLDIDVLGPLGRYFSDRSPPEASTPTESSLSIKAAA
jgi:hypothetical protein